MRSQRLPVVSVFAFLFLFIFFAVSAATVNAATFVVDTTADTVDASPGDGTCADSGGACSLRAAIGEANALAGDDTITLPSGTYTITISGSEDNVNAVGDLDITSNITINGAGAATTFVEAATSAGAATTRVFDVTAPNSSDSLTVTLNNMTVRYGLLNIAESGAGIRINQGTSNSVTLSDLIIANNRSYGLGGGMSVRGTTPTVSMSNCQFNSNYSGGTSTTVGGAYGAGIYLEAFGTFVISGSSFDNNQSRSEASGIWATGGAITMVGGGGLTISNSSFTGNSAIVAAGATTASATGGAISAQGTTPNLAISNSTFTGNTVSVGTGGAGGASGGAIAVAVGSTVTVSGSAFTNNTASITSGTYKAFGGAIVGSSSTMTISSSSFTGNSATRFGAIRSISTTAASALTITDSTITGNTATEQVGGVGAVVNTTANSTANINGSTISGNTAGTNGGGLFFGSGGTGVNTVNITNSTVSGNSAVGGGGGIYVEQGPTVVNLNFATVAGNTAATSGGLYAGPTTQGYNLKNSVVALNVGTTSGNDLGGTFTSQGYNHIQDTAGGTFTPSTGDVTGTDPLLGALASNGGPTKTQAPEAFSPLINAIPDGTNGCGTTVTLDQRGSTRPQVGACDKGAYETALTTAANAVISGRVLTASGRPVKDVVITVTGTGTDRVFTVRTNQFGRFSVDGLPVGGLYFVQASSRKLQFQNPLRTVDLTDDFTEADFVVLR